MAIDVVKEMIGLKNAYGRARGAGPATGKRRPGGGTWMRAGKQVPLTTWGDVLVAAAHIDKHLNPSMEQCLELVKKHKGAGAGEAALICTSGDRLVNPRAFQRTPTYGAAKRNFDSVTPIGKFGVFGVTRFMNRLGEIYPHNEEFWGAAETYAIARSAAGVVPYWSEMAVESVKEAISELPENIAAGLAALDPRRLVPDFGGLAELIKWGSIGGGLFVLYWYVLKPQKKRKKLRA